MIPNNEPSARYWTTGIVLTWHPRAQRGPSDESIPGWSGTIDYCDDGWVGDNNADTGAVSTEGTLHTRYAVVDGKTRTALSAVVDALIADAGRLGINFVAGPGDLPNLYYKGDGEHSDFPPPDGWRALLAAEAERIGWTTYAMH